MKYQSYSLRDVVADAFHFPFYAGNDAHALRIARSLSFDELAEHRADFQVWHVGEFDNQSGEFTPSKLTKIGDLDHGAAEQEKPVGNGASVRKGSFSRHPAKSV